MLRFLTILLIIPGVAFSQTLPSLKLSDNNRYIVTENDSPFFWLGDTAWELFHRLDRDEAIQYLNNRAAKGFNVIQAVALAELDGLHTPNAEGERPLLDNDPTKPNEKYFELVDFIIKEANQRGMYVGLLPTWGDKFNKKWGVGPEVFTTENAYIYGKFIAGRYNDSGIIWILGGDRNPEEPEDFEIIRAMAKGIKEGSNANQLITYHPQGGSSGGDFFKNDDWMDLIMYQSGHGESYNPNHKRTSHWYGQVPVKPVLDGEPCYEDHPINWNSNNGWFDEFESRRAGYWSILAGACGHTYGHHAIWQMWEEGRDPVSQARTPWSQSLNFPGAWQAGYMKSFFSKLPWQELLPRQDLLESAPNQGGSECLLAASASNDLIVAYIPYGNTIRINVKDSPLKDASLTWFNPRQGTYIDARAVVLEEEFEADPPGDPREGNDWVMILHGRGWASDTKN